MGLAVAMIDKISELGITELEKSALFSLVGILKIVKQSDLKTFDYPMFK